MYVILVTGQEGRPLPRGHSERSCQRRKRGRYVYTNLHLLLPYFKLCYSNQTYELDLTTTKVKRH